MVLEAGADAVEGFLEPGHAGYSPKKSLSSRAADSGESLPWTTFSVMIRRQIAADRARWRVGGVGGTHQIPPQRDRVVSRDLRQRPPGRR